MKAIFSIALILEIGCLVVAADKVDLVGTWKCEYEIDGRMRMFTLTIKKDGDKLEATMNRRRRKETGVKDLKLKDEILTFSAVRKFMDNEFTVEYSLKIDGDTLKGKGAADFEGEKREYDRLFVRFFRAPSAHLLSERK